MRTYTHYTNQELLTGLQQGDRMAFTEIYNRYWKKIYIIAYNRMCDGAQSEDIAQEVFASLWANRGYVQIETLENYLATAAKYLVLTAIRKKTLSRNYGQRLKNSTVSQLTPESTFQNKQILQLLELEIEKLPEKCKLIFKYSRNEGMATKQIAAKLHITPKTVDNQIHKALKILKLASRSFMQFILLLFI
ncbi:RNA polymerase sigma-70 factor [Arachidicoccus ginsenosidivorans]|jgi:RNA polymerase sigma-70 factor (ECF subfamily)|uniref:RNA polymerase sigma-70 factor n=1 Tax=Arachidicoccus ginsenosidivorans TaxID=496057 RepID=A0A5B8VQ00_9BACT|nr:RNA polymerase sigma-70 factor [Arachidicoccus ginsenosidivorans]QEC72972.1 RNA polymerase sigma-70 factor [Arachidicoccus ginsenosidivorans]